MGFSSKEEEDIIKVLAMGRSGHSLPPKYAPSLVFPHGKKYRDQIFCTLSDEAYHVKSVPEMCRMRCLQSSYGWLVLQSHFDSTQCYLFNPVTLTKIHLPQLIHYTFGMPVLTASPSDPNCVIMFFSDKKKSLIYSRIRDTFWIEHKLGTEANNKSRKLLKGPFDGVISCQGKIYLFLFNTMAVIDVNDSNVSINMHERKFIKGSFPEAECSSGVYFVESCGEIFQVVLVALGFSPDIIRTVDVFKLDLSTMVDWVGVESISDRIFLLGTSSTSISAAEFRVKGNCMYFCPSRYTNLNRFDMEDGTITTTLPCPTKFSNWDTPFWIVPTEKLQVNKDVAKVSTSHAEVNDEENSSWKDLPIELLELILSSLFLGDCIRFRLTWKTCISVTPPPRANPSLVQFDPQQLPWLMSFPKVNKGVCNFYHPVYSDSYTMDMQVPELEGAIIRDARYGWLLMSQGWDALIFFFNPLTKEIIKLPDRKELYYFVGITFSALPTSSNCIIFGISPCFGEHVIVTIFFKDENTWCVDDYVKYCKVPYEFMASDCNPVFYDGAFYCLSKDGKVGVFNPDEDDDLEWQVLPVPPVISIRLEKNRTKFRSFIMEYDGEIISAFVGLFGKSVQVYKLDQSKMKWVRLESLNGKVMFLSQAGSLLVLAALKGIENRIYLPRFKGKEGVFYSLESGNYHYFGGKDSRPDWVDTSEACNCTWIQTQDMALQMLHERKHMHFFPFSDYDLFM